MKFSTTTGIYTQNGTDQLRYLNDALHVLHKVGYRELDLSLYQLNHPQYILKGDDWEQKIDALGNTAAELGITFYQCHLPFVKGGSMLHSSDHSKSGYPEYFDECMRRAYVASGMLGIRWAVTHPMTFSEYNYESKASLEANRAYIDKYIELGVGYGTGTAFENMLPSMDRALPNRYCQHYDQLIELVDSYGDLLVGICWDTGHANQNGLDQQRAMRAVGHRLRALHINDNHYGFRDEHLLPYMGNIDWKGFIQGLMENGYQGTLNYETGNVTRYAHGDIQMQLIQLTYQNGLALLEMYEKILT